jgi:hypothetical protein
VKKVRGAKIAGNVVTVVKWLGEIAQARSPKAAHLLASQRLAKSLRQSIFLRAKPPMSPLQASIAPATWQVINAFVPYGTQCQLSLDRASLRHGGVDAE